MEEKSWTFPNAFIMRRLHSLAGIMLVLFLCEHLLTNSQAALLFGNDGSGFVRMVNLLHDLPYLHVIELVLIAFPFLVHGIWGLWVLRTAQYNVVGSDASKPVLKEERNWAYTLQRWTSWILLVGVIFHVVQMRFVAYPVEQDGVHEKEYAVRIEKDSALPRVAEHLGAQLEERNEGNVVAVTPSFGVAVLLTVRDTFKQPLYVAFYTLFVLCTVYHAFNGLWTAMISWGITLTPRSQRWMWNLSLGLMIVVAFLGMTAIWGTYWGW